MQKIIYSMRRTVLIFITMFCVTISYAQTIYSDSKMAVDQIEKGTYKISYLDEPNYATIYVIEGNKKALVIDTGDKNDVNFVNLIKLCTDKPYTLVLTHTHGDHTMGIDQFPELYVNPKENQRQLQESYKGKVNYMQDGMKFDLGGRVIQAFEISGHTDGGMIFADEATGNCYVGDCFGTGQVWLQMNPSDTPISDYLSQVNKMLKLMETHHITHLYTGHFGQENCIYGLNYIQDMKYLAEDMLAGDYESVHHDRSPETAKTQMTRRNRAVIVFNPDKVK